MNYLNSNKLRSQLRKVFWITVAWTVISLIQYFSVYSLMLELEVEPTQFGPKEAFIGSLLKGILAGSLGGSTLVFLWDKWLQSKNYAWILLFPEMC